VSNMNGQTRKKLYAVLATEDGEYCKCCGLLPSEGQLIVDHKDNDNSNNARENLQLLCRRCNYLKNPRRPVDMCEREKEYEDETELQNNKKNEPLFRKYVFCRLNENDGKPIPEKDLCYGGAEHIENSPITCQRYLFKMCSVEGILRRWRPVKTMVVGYKKELDFA